VHCVLVLQTNLFSTGKLVFNWNLQAVAPPPPPPPPPVLHSFNCRFKDNLGTMVSEC